MLRIIQRPLILLISLSMIFCLACCGEPDGPTAEYGDHTEYAGIWYSEPGDDRAFVFHEDGTYQMYTVKPGGTPELAEQGIFKRWTNVLHLAEDSDGESFVITGQLSISAKDTLHLNYTEFVRIGSETDIALLDELTAMTVPLEAYIGEWENDTVYAQLAVNETAYSLNEDGSISSGTYIIGTDFLWIGLSDDGQRLTVTDDGGLALDGMEGVFYPAGSGKGAPSPYALYAGDWINSLNSEMQVSFSADGTFGLYFDGSMSMGTFSVQDGVISFSDYTATLSDDGKLTVSGIDGVFEKQ